MEHLTIIDADINAQVLSMYTFDVSYTDAKNEEFRVFLTKDGYYVWPLFCKPKRTSQFKFELICRMAENYVPNSDQRNFKIDGWFTYDQFMDHFYNLSPSRTLASHISKFYGYERGAQKRFAEKQSVQTPQVTQWLEKDMVVVGTKLYSFRRDLNMIDETTDNPNNHPYMIELTEFLYTAQKQPDLWVLRLRTLLNSIPAEILIDCIDKKPSALLKIFNLSNLIDYSRSAENPNLTNYILSIPGTGNDGSINPTSELQHITTLGIFADFIMNRDFPKNDEADIYLYENIKYVFAIINAAFPGLPSINIDALLE